jgi:hypothetical protein
MSRIPSRSGFYTGRQLQRVLSNGAKCTAFFKFKNPLRGSSEDAGNYYNSNIGWKRLLKARAAIMWRAYDRLWACAGVYASQKREDFSADDVEHYFNYMGMLATEVCCCIEVRLSDCGLSAAGWLKLVFKGLLNYICRALMIASTTCSHVRSLGCTFCNAFICRLIYDTWLQRTFTKMD